MQPHDDDGDAGDDRELVRNRRASAAPITLALAPSATNTVEKPQTNSSAASTVCALEPVCGSPSASRSSEVPAR